MNAVRTENLHFSYGVGKEKQEALRGLSFDCVAGRITGILGPNGSGKSTTFKILSTQILPHSGNAWVFGHSVLTEREVVRRQMGVTFQSPSLDPMLTIRENLEIHAALYGLKKSDSLKRIKEVLGTLQLEDRQMQKIKGLSGGLARRVELAKTLLSQPKLLLLDEPTTGLDPLLRREFWSELRKLVDHGMSVLVTTHLMDEAELCDELIFLTEGQLAAQGSPAKLKSDFGADIISLEAPKISEKLSVLKAKLSVADKIETLDGRLRIESREPLKVFDLLRQEWGSELQSLNWGKPTLGDVYLSRTGKNL